MNNYISIKKNIKPLDLILFKGTSVYSKFIQLNSRITTNCDDYSHVGLVITKDILNLPELEYGKLYIWESVSSSEKHPPLNIYGKSFIGSQIRYLDDVIKEYSKSKNAKISICHLIDSKRPPIDILKIRMKPLYHKYNYKFYDINPCTLFSSVYGCFRCCTDKFDTLTKDWLFCSELVAHIYRDLAIIPKDVDPKYVIPVDFIGHDNENMPVVVSRPVIIK